MPRETQSNHGPATTPGGVRRVAERGIFPEERLLFQPRTPSKIGGDRRIDVFVAADWHDPDYVATLSGRAEQEFAMKMRAVRRGLQP